MIIFQPLCWKKNNLTASHIFCVGLFSVFTEAIEVSTERLMFLEPYTSSIKGKYFRCVVHHLRFLPIQADIFGTLESLASRLESKLNFSGFEQLLAAGHKFVMTHPLFLVSEI